MKLWFERGAWASQKGRRKAATLSPDRVQSIAVIRHAALGDMVLVRCFIAELRKHFPRATITLSMVSNYTYGAPEDMVDRLHVIHGSDQRDVPLREKIRRIRELGYHDLVFDLAATSRSFWTCLLNPAILKIGFPYRPLQRRLYYDLAILRSDFKFEAEVMLDMLNLIGCKTDYPPDFHMPVDAAERAQPYIIYFTSASTLSKCWPEDNFAALIAHAAKRYPEVEHLVLEGKEDWESVDGLMQQLGSLTNVHKLTAMPLEETMSLLKGAQLVVCNDTGIRNLAISLETPTLGIFYSTVPYRYWPRYGNHDVTDGSVPPVEAVAESLDKLMARDDA